MNVVEVFGDVAEIFAKMNPEKIVELKAPKLMSDRVEELIRKKKTDKITIEETVELERYLSLDLLINLAKARAKLLLKK